MPKRSDRPLFYVAFPPALRLGGFPLHCRKNAVLWRVLRQLGAFVMEEEESLVVFMTVGPQLAQRCATPFYMANMAAVMEMQADVFLQIDGVLLMKRGVADDLYAKSGGKAILGFIREAKEAGVRMHCCSSALALHDMTTDDLIEECDGVGGAAHMLEAAANATTVLVY